MGIYKDANSLFFVAYWDRRPITDDLCTGNASVHHILSHFLPFNAAITDILMQLSTVATVPLFSSLNGRENPNLNIHLRFNSD